MLVGYSKIFNSDYYQKSFLHKINPTIKLFGIIFLLVLTFLPSMFLCKIFLIFLSIILWKMSKNSFHSYCSILKSCFVMFIIMLLINWITFKAPSCQFDLANTKKIIGGSWDDLLNWGWIKKSEEGIYWWHSEIWGGSIVDKLVKKSDPNGNFLTLGCFHNQTFYLQYSSAWYALSSQTIFVVLKIIIKIYLTITFTTILTSTSTPIQLTYAIENMLKPLKYLKIPVNEIAMIISIAIRFIPNLIDEAGKIKKAQITRGVNFNGNFYTKTKAIIALSIPMFSIAFRKANDLANAMEARNYQPKKNRTRYRVFLVKKNDLLFLLSILLLFALMLYFFVSKTVFAPLFLFDCYFF